MNDERDLSHAPPRGARVMNLLRWILFAFLLVLAAASIVTYLASRHAGPERDRTAKAVTVYHCPMHPNYTSDRPGDCPICGMRLVPVRPPEGEDASGAGAARGDVAGLTSVRIEPERLQRIGLRTAIVQSAPLGGEVDLVGFVTTDETRLRRVQLRTSGWVRRLVVSQTGEHVRRGDALLSIYSPELFQSEQEALIESGGDSLAGPPMHAGTAAAMQRLRLLGVPEDELRRLERERAATSEIVLRSPVEGTVLERGVTEGQYVGPDTPLFTLADLSRVWVLADLYEMDFARVRVGDRARFVADALPDRPFAGRIEFVYPTVSSETRTIKVRVGLDNPGGILRPGMYGRMRVAGPSPVVLSIPSEAVVNTGEHAYVFVVHAGGVFEPRHVQVGPASSERVRVVSGLAEGDTVVSSASFLIDSESRLEAAIAGMGAQPGAGHVHGGTP